MRKFAFVLLFFVCLLIAACLVACKSTLPASSINEKKDSSAVTKDSIYSLFSPEAEKIYLPGDTVYLKVPIECDKATNKPIPASGKANGNHSELIFQLKNGILTVKSRYDSALKVINYQKETIHDLKETVIKVSKTKEETKPVVQYKSYWYDPFCRTVTIILLIAVALYLIINKIKSLVP